VTVTSPPGRRQGRAVLALACVAVAFAAADTYVVVVALPEMMTGVGLGIDELQRAAPIVSGFLLGYITMLPLIGRIADLRGHVPVLVASLVLFAVGSLVTAAAYDLGSVVVGRFLQGVGGGGLVPATLALVAQMWPAERRGVPLGVVGAVQELGSVLGPLYGALVLVVFDWRAIFWLNLVVGLALAVGIRLAARPADHGVAPAPAGAPQVAHPALPPPRVARSGWVSAPNSAASRQSTTGGSHFAPLDMAEVGEPAYDIAGAGLGVLVVAALGLLLSAPARLTGDVTWGLAWVPLFGGSRWAAPLGIAVIALTASFVARELTARRPLVDLRAVPELARRADLLGAALLALALGGVVLAFATTDPQVQVFSPAGPWLLCGAAVAAGLFWLRQRSASEPMVPRQALRARAAWGSLLVSFFVGAALIAALVDIPVFARVTRYPDSQLGAALVLLRFLVALPVGALLGGWLTRRFAPGPLTAAGMVLAATGFGFMASWPLGALNGPAATAALVLAGLGFGLAIAPVNAALLGATTAAVHGVASALVVVARMIGMLVGVSALTTLGLRRFYDVAATLPRPGQVCPRGLTACPAYDDLLRTAALAELHAIFLGAAACSVLAAGLALVLYRQAGARTVPTAGRIWA
jgi:MFS family permease